jgi:hypothetical protein
LTALCNDIEFGKKDAALIEFNEFLQTHRERIREFIIDTTKNIPQETQSEIGKMDKKHLSSLSSWKSSSALKSQKQSRVFDKEEQIKPNLVNMMLVCLQKNMDKLEQECRSKHTNLIPKISELKVTLASLNLQGNASTADLPFPSRPKNSGWWAKAKAKLNSIFVK